MMLAECLKLEDFQINLLAIGQYFKGEIDEVRVFNTLLTDDQIQQDGLSGD
jgi:hypothetical protein